MEENIHNMLEVFIVVHDTSILDQLEKEKHFSMLPDYRYILVGNTEQYDLRDLNYPGKTIIAQSLPDNIEEHNNLLTFTAWYAIAKNHLAHSKYIAILEYDVDLDQDFYQRTFKALEEGRRIVGYIPFPLSHPQYLYATDWLIDSLSKIYDIDSASLIDKHISSGNKDLWTSTTNLAMTLKDMKNFANWFLQLSTVFRHDPVGGHVHERTVPIYCILNNIENYYLKDTLLHHQKRSHGARVRNFELAQQHATAVKNP